MGQRSPGLKPWAILLSHFMAMTFNHSRRSRSFSDFAPLDRPLALSVPGVPGAPARSRRCPGQVTHHSIAV